MSFLAAALRSIREWAEELEEWEEELNFVPLAAHLFAVGTQLLLNEGSARMMERFNVQDVGQKNLDRKTKLEFLRLELVRLSDRTDGTTLYQTILKALLTIESVLVEEPTSSTSLKPFTDLKPLHSEEFRGIGGRVYHWIRPASALAALRNSRIESPESHPPDPMPHPGTYLRRLSLYWDSDPQLPRLSRVQHKAKIDSFFSPSENKAPAIQRFKIALCPLEGPFHPRFELKEEGRFFQALRRGSIVGAAALKTHLETVVKVATGDKEDVHLIFFPELTVDADARSELQSAISQSVSDKCSLYGVVAGSFHLWDEAPEGAAGPDHPPVNETVFLDHTGKPVMVHRKKGRFRIDSKKLSPKLFTGIPERVLPREIFEDIRYGSELSILDTSLGRISILICADAIAADDRGYLPLIRRLRPDLLFVVSMSDETEPFEAFAEEMRRYWIGTVFVNAHCILKEVSEAKARAAARRSAEGKPPKEDSPPPPHLAAWNLALYEADGCPPTLGRWRFDQEPECFYFKESTTAPKGWRSVSQDPDPNGVSLLRGEAGQTLGIVLDLGVQWPRGEG